MPNQIEEAAEEASAAFVDFLMEEPDGLEQAETYEEAEAAMLELSHRMTPQEVVRRLCSSCYGDKLLKRLASKYADTGMWGDFIQGVLLIPVERWCGRSGIECFCTDTASEIFAGDPLFGNTLVNGGLPIREQEDHPLWRVADPDAYWEYVVMTRLEDKDFARAYDEIRRAHRGIRVPSIPPAKDPVKALAEWRGSFRMTATRTTLAELIHRLHRLMRLKDLVPVVHEGDEAVSCSSNAPGYTFAVALSHGGTDARTRGDVFSSTGRMVLYIAKHIAGERNDKRKKRREFMKVN
jgi:hypothetical protein